MTVRTLLGLILFVLAVLLGTILDRRWTPPAPPDPTVMVADLHIHPYPGDGSLPVWELQHEARRRGLNVIGITGHNNRLGLKLGEWLRLDSGEAMVIPGQEITAPDFHLVAIGTRDPVDWRLKAVEAIEAIQAQGGVAIAAHPVSRSWRPADHDTLAALDGAEVAHGPTKRPYDPADDEYLQFFSKAQIINPGVAPIGSSDFHMTAPLGFCRTFLFVEERSPAAVLDAVRRGRTVALDPQGRLFGSEEDIERVREYLAATPIPGVSGLERISAVFALLALAVLAYSR
ncbi:MAG TPA: CehA/McbA family metallohydrolase [Vicinamibacterales bacterium]